MHRFRCRKLWNKTLLFKVYCLAGFPNLSFFRHSIILTKRFTVNGWTHSREEFCIMNTMLLKNSAWCFQIYSLYLWTHGLHSLDFLFIVSKGGSKNLHFLTHTHTHTSCCRVFGPHLRKITLIGDWYLFRIPPL